jgi:membrane protease YdiL (CAAX protease family)
MVASSVVLVATGGADGGDTPIPSLGASLVAGWAVFLLGTWGASRVLGSGDARDDFGLTTQPIDLLGVPVGAVAQLVLIPAVYVPLQQIWPSTFDDDSLSETARDLVDRADGAQIVVLFALVVLGAPLVEEIVYRGLLQRPMLRFFRPWMVVVGVAALFAALHLRPIEFPGLFVAGLLFGLVAWRTGRVGGAVATHVGFNITGLVLAL